MKAEHGLIIVLSIMLVGVSLAWTVTSMESQTRWWIFDNIGNFSYSDFPTDQHPETNFNFTTPNFVVNDTGNGIGFTIGWRTSSLIDSTSHFDIFVYRTSSDSAVQEIISPNVNQTIGGAYSDFYSDLNLKGSFYLKIFIVGHLSQWTIQVTPFETVPTSPFPTTLEPFGLVILFLGYTVSLFFVAAKAQQKREKEKQVPPPPPPNFPQQQDRLAV